MILVFHGMEPCQYLPLKLFGWHIGRFVFHIEHGRQIATLQMHLVEEELSLFAG